MTRTSDKGRRGSRNVEDAARRFEETVEDLASRAGDEMGEWAAEFLDDAADRLRGEREAGTGRRRERSRSRKRRRGHHWGYEPYDWRGARSDDYEPYNWGWGWRSRKLYLDDDNRKLVGVCGGIANYFGMEAWVVRCIAVTGLIFMPGIVFPAYWVAYFVMDHPPEGEGEEDDQDEDGKRKRRRRRWKPRPPRPPGLRRRARNRDPDAGDGARHDHTAPAPEMGVRFSPRRSLRAVQADFMELELRLRRMETHVTSGQFELQRELRKIAD